MYKSICVYVSYIAVLKKRLRSLLNATWTQPLLKFRIKCPKSYEYKETEYSIETLRKKRKERQLFESSYSKSKTQQHLYSIIPEMNKCIFTQIGGRDVVFLARFFLHRGLIAPFSFIPDLTHILICIPHYFRMCWVFWLLTVASLLPLSPCVIQMKSKE